MQIPRRFSTAGQNPYDAVPFRTATSEIRNPDGSVVFQADGIEVPALSALTDNTRLGGETIAREFFDRTAGTWTYRGWKGSDEMY